MFAFRSPVCVSQTWITIIMHLSSSKEIIIAFKINSKPFQPYEPVLNYSHCSEGKLQDLIKVLYRSSTTEHASLAYRWRPLTWYHGCFALYSIGLIREVYVSINRYQYTITFFKAIFFFISRNNSDIPMSLLSIILLDINGGLRSTLLHLSLSLKFL